jgi:hypothetical protein
LRFDPNNEIRRRPIDRGAPALLLIAIPDAPRLIRAAVI